MIFEKKIDGMHVFLRIDGYRNPSKHEFGTVWCDCGFSFSLRNAVAYRKDSDSILTPHEIDWLAEALTDLLDGKITAPREIGMLEPDFVFLLYPAKAQHEDDKTVNVFPGSWFDDVYAEWRVCFWNDGAPTDNYLTVILAREDVKDLRDFLNKCKKV